MITDWLLLHPVRAWVTIASCLAVGAWCVRRGAAGRRTAGWVAVLAVVPALGLTLVPVHRQLYAVCVVQFSLPTSLRVGDVLANVVLFVPAAWFWTLATRRPVTVAVSASALSAAVEAVQAAVPAIGRSCDTNDWLGNTTGAVGAVLVAGLLARTAAPHRAISRPAPSSRSRGR